MALLYAKPLSNENSNSIISLEHAAMNYLTIDGRRTFEIGAPCGTCEFYINRIGDYPKSLPSIEKLRFYLEMGHQHAFPPPELINVIAAIVPNGKYLLLYEELVPKPIMINQPDNPGNNYAYDYYPILEKVALPDRFVRCIHSLTDSFDEHLLPLFQHHTLNADAVKKYEEMLKASKQPVALAVSCANIHSDGIHLRHFLLDGHHKLEAAARVQKPLRLISFLSEDFSVGWGNGVNLYEVVVILREYA